MTKPGFVNFGVSLMKYFRVTEHTKLQFRWETFNTPNTVQLGTPNTAFVAASTAAGGLNSSGLFGRIFSARDARKMQIALKLIF